ncbi:MAG TPA: hypothetical protein VM370_07100 [Candidatus Thermoplasmatota archaeon]|nr:hypothetical protein [Candidatus Thermoplasmatota archaeon]
MGLVWNPWALPWLLSSVLHVSTCLFIYGVAGDRLLNRALAVTLFFAGVIGMSYGLSAMTTDLADSYALTVMGQIAKFVVGMMYPVFVGAALRTPFTAWLRARSVRTTFIGLAVVLPVIGFLRPGWFIGDRLARAGPFAWSVRPAAQAFDTVAALLFLYALVASISACRRAAPGTPARDRARWFMLAFGIRDVVIAGSIVSAFVVLLPDTVGYELTFNVLVPTLLSLYVVMIVYGVLRWHLFDLDLHIKWTLRRGTLGAIFVGVFLVVTQLAQNGFADRFGWIWGGIAAGLLLFALVPLQRLVDRFANAAMPEVSGSAEYLAHRRAEVYLAALEEILVDGEISPKERAILERLRAKLGLGADTAAALERDALLARRPAAGESGPAGEVRAG